MNILSGYHYFTLRLFQTDRILFCELKIIALVRALQGVVCTALRRPTKKNSPNFSHTCTVYTIITSALGVDTGAKPVLPSSPGTSPQ